LALTRAGGQGLLSTSRSTEWGNTDAEANRFVRYVLARTGYFTRRAAVVQQGSRWRASSDRSLANTKSDHSLVVRGQEMKGQAERAHALLSPKVGPSENGTRMEYTALALDEYSN
jgi:hypothetical protein